MLTQTKSPDTAGGGGPGSQNFTRENDSTSEKPPVKLYRVLAAFSHGKRFNRFQAEIELSDHTLPSTVSALQAKGVTINRRSVTVPGYHGCPTVCCEYWLASESLDRARELLNGKRQATEGDDHASVS